ncbi:MAG: arsenate reductase [Ignavibacteria bacterium GWA2_35_9]|nr:MAG: arsenate reductase [Ignavibacteria bacterium GWA2_35_9]OGU47414.1 MAG: arsenate reductase [Ignavibacteria bacterium GWB2_36_8]OGU50543.1 MAG: arsenate reductase [Ignavibacteria bacterium GWC2_36_12]
MKKITVYEKPTCTTCRKVVKEMEMLGIDFEKINYYIEPFSKTKLKSLLKKMKMKPAEIMRTKEKIYKELGIKNKKYSDKELINLMVEHPDLVQRPIIEMGDKAILARPPEKIKELFK